MDSSLPCDWSHKPYRILVLTFFASVLPLCENRLFAQTPEVTVFPAWNANVEGNLQIQGVKEAASIHYWNRPEDTISWNWPAARQGNYRAELHYSLDQAMRGGSIALNVGVQQLVAPAEPSGRWTDFRTFRLGVISVQSDGDLPVTLQAIEMPDASNAALPDVAWLCLTPTDDAATSISVSGSGPFQGEPIFDGKTFDGWEGDQTWFRIEDGTIVAGDLSRPIPQNEFLVTQREYSDFELRLKVKLVGGEGNGGVQFRSQRVQNGHEMLGYQADCGAGIWGGLYDESRRSTFLGTRLNADATAAVLKPDDWNRYAIRCEGPCVRLWLNDVLTLDYIEEDASVPQVGFIGLQIHSGGPSEVHYKDIQLESLASFADAPKLIDEETNARFEALGWRVGIQSYTFTEYSLFEAIDAASALGLKCVEATTWQRIEPGKDDRFNPWWMSQETKQRIKDRCREKGVFIASVYCRPSKEDIQNQSDQVERIFQFCKEMNCGLTTDPIRVESGFGSMEFYDELCQKYGVKMFLTNHPKSHGSPYWNPDDVLADCQGRSKNIGGSVDVGHFMRDGTDVYDAVRKYTDADRMYHWHLRDVDKLAPDGKDVVLGQGAARISDAFKYMNDKGATPLLVFEYERDQHEPLKYIAPGLMFLKELATRLETR